MSKRFLTVLVAIFCITAAHADGEGADSVVLITVSDIRSGEASLVDWDQVSSGQPDGAALDVLQEAGFTTVIDMRARVKIAASMRQLRLPPAT